MNAGVYVPNVKDSVFSPLFDTLKSAGVQTYAATLTLFQNVVNVAGVGPEVTNMTKAGELKSPEDFEVHALRLAFLGCAAADIISFMKAYTVQLIVGSKVYLNAPAEFWPGGGGPIGSTATGNGISDPRAIYGLGDLAIPIPNGTNFKVQCIGSGTCAITADFCMRVYLDGVYRRGVQ